MRYRTWLTLGLLLLGLPVPTGEAAPPDRVPPRVQQQIQTEGSARVLVRLHLPAGRFKVEGELPPASVTRQRNDVATVQSQVIARLRGKRHEVLRQYRTVPLLALEVGPDGLAELVAAFPVAAIVEDRLRFLQLGDSVPLIEGDLAWANGFDGTGTVVAVLDTGVERLHPFLAGKVVEEACYSSTLPGQSQTVCPNGKQSQTGTNSARPCTLSECFHGTHVAGVVAGNGAGAGVSFSGVAKGAQLMAIQVFSRITSSVLCGGVAPCLGAWESDIIAGLERVYERRNARNLVAANLSLGGELFSAPCANDVHKPIIDNLRAAGIATIVASGNDGSIDSIAAPACVPTAVSVGSTGPTDEVSWFSNVAPFLTLFAPGEGITSAMQGGGFLPADGTSAATPHVAGAWAVLKQAAPSATVDQVLAALVSTGLPVTEPFSEVTKPRIRVFEALAVLATVPLIGVITPSRGGPGETLDVTIAGANFQSGATVSLGAEIDVTEVTVNSPTEIVATVSIALSAVLGPRTVTVTNPDASVATRVDGFRVALPPPHVALAWSGKLRDRVRQSEGAAVGDGVLDGTLTATVTATGGRPRTVTQLVLTGGGQWDTIPLNDMWTLGAADTVDAPVKNAGNGSVSFVVQNGAFVVFATDVSNALFQPGRQLTLTATFEDDAVVSASVTIPAPPPPPGVTLVWNGKVQDRVRQSEGAAVGDGAPDGTFTATVAGPPRTVTRLVLTGGGQWDTIPGNGMWTLGAADTPDTAVMKNAGDGSVNFAVQNGTFAVFATDMSNALFPAGRQFTLTVTFSDDTVAAGSVTIPAVPTVTGVTPAGGEQGAAVSVAVTGTNFQPGATLSVGAGVTVSGVAVPSGTQLTATLTIAGGAAVGPRDVVVTNLNGASGTRTDGFTVTAPGVPPPPPPGVTLVWNGKVQDRVRQSEGAAVGDGAPDGTFTATVTGPPRTVTRLVLTGGGQWDTIPGNGMWTLGAADTPDTAVMKNAGDGSVNFAVQNGTFAVFATDMSNALFPAGRQFTLTVTFSDDTVAAGSVTIPAVPTVTGVTPAGGEQGAAVSVAVTGTNFQPGATLSVGAGVTVSGVAVPSGTQLTATLTIAGGAAVGPRDVVVTNLNGASGTRTDGFTVTAPGVPPPPPPGVTLVWNGKVQDRVRQSEGAAVGDGAPDGTFTATVTGPPRTVTRLVLTGGGQWDTIPGNGMWTLGAADTPDTAVMKNAGDGSVNFAVQNGTFAVFATDMSNALFPAGRQFTLTVTFSDDTVAAGSVTIPAVPTVTGVTPAGGEQGAAVSVAVTGTNFQPGATLSVGAGVTVSGVAVPSGTQLTATLTIAGGAAVGPRDVVVTNLNGASGTRTDGFTVTAPGVPPPPPPGVTLVWNGKVQDRVRQSEGAAVGDGAPDGTFTATVTGPPRTVTRLVLTGGGQWDTIPGNGMWTLGAADTPDTAVMKNAGDGSVNFAVQNGTFAVFATDMSNALFPAGRQFTLTVTFSDDTVAAASVTIP